MLSKDDIQKICFQELSSLNLGRSCDLVANSLVTSSPNTAARELEKIILCSITNCLYKTLQEYDSQK